MEVFTTLFLLAILVAIFIAILKKVSTRRENLYKPSRHGHRCFADDLDVFEAEVVQILSENLNYNDYFIFNNIILPSDNGGSTQIDHIVVSRFGIFVIESKDYSGWVYAHKNRKEWTVTYKYGQKYTMQNPLFQNFAHTATLKKLMPYASKYIRSVVVFSDYSEFKTPKIHGLLHLSELIGYIKSYNEVKLKPVELFVTIGHLAHLCQAIDISSEEHVNNITNHVESKISK